MGVNAPTMFPQEKNVGERKGRGRKPPNPMKGKAKTNGTFNAVPSDERRKTGHAYPQKLGTFAGKRAEGNGGEKKKSGIQMGHKKKREWMVRQRDARKKCQGSQKGRKPGNLSQLNQRGQTSYGRTGVRKWGGEGERGRTCCSVLAVKRKWRSALGKSKGKRGRHSEKRPVPLRAVGTELKKRKRVNLLSGFQKRETKEPVNRLCRKPRKRKKKSPEKKKSTGGKKREGEPAMSRRGKAEKSSGEKER